MSRRNERAGGRRIEFTGLAERLHGISYRVGQQRGLDTQGLPLSIIPPSRGRLTLSILVHPRPTAKRSSASAGESRQAPLATVILAGQHVLCRTRGKAEGKRARPHLGSCDRG